MRITNIALPIMYLLKSQVVMILFNFQKLNCIIDEQNGKVSPNTSSSTCEDEPQEFELVSQAKSPISNSSIKIEKKKRDKRKVSENYFFINK